MKKQVEIFKTNVEQESDAKEVIKYLKLHFPHYRANFDLEDCDCILRIEASKNFINEQEIVQLMCTKGYACMHLT